MKYEKNILMKLLRGGCLALALGALLLTGCGKPTEPPTESKSADAARSMPDFGGLEKTSTEAIGIGTTLSAAVDDAIRNAIRQVNGQTLNASSESVQHAIAVGLGDTQVQLSSDLLAQRVATQSRGAVTEFELISHKQRNGRFEAAIKASVARLRKPDGANKTRLVVAPLRMPDAAQAIGERRIDAPAVGLALRTAIGNALAQTQRFMLLEREFEGEIERELAFIESGNVAKDEYARLDQALAADLIWIGKLEQFHYTGHARRLRTSDRQLISYSGGAVLSYRLINVATRQTVLSDSITIRLPDTEPTTLGTPINAIRISDDLIGELSQRTAQSVINKLFPITLVALQGDEAIMSQGGKTLQEKRRYRVYQLGAELKDPQSGHSLGRMESECCTVEVTRVTDDLAYGRLLNRKIELPAIWVPGSLEVREEIADTTSAAEQPVHSHDRATEQREAAAVAETTAAEAAAHAEAAKKRDKDW